MNARADAIREGRAKEVRLLIGNNLNDTIFFAIGAPLTEDPTAEQMSYVDSEALADQINTTYRRHFPQLSDNERRLRLMTSQGVVDPGAAYGRGPGPDRRRRVDVPLRLGTHQWQASGPGLP